MIKRIPHFVCKKFSMKNFYTKTVKELSNVSDGVKDFLLFDREFYHFFKEFEN